jgi:hypothetical protein
VNDVLKWKEDIYKKMDPEDVKNLPIILVGNKVRAISLLTPIKSHDRKILGGCGYELERTEQRANGRDR